MRNVEILAPVGKMSMLYAGLSAGACSFYLALDDFGARAYAKNFSLENIEEVIDYVHLFDKKVFITINTLIKDEEIDKAIFYIEKLFEYGADAILIQDIDLYSLVKNINKNARHKLEFHASTQMAIKDYEGAITAKKLGFDRVVVARETEIDEIEKICKLDIDTEVFVHGSLCVSFSGECLMSSYLGKRSANRGRCAGICRKKYQLINDGKVLGEDYYLSMKDLSTIDFIDDLIKAGVDSLKIEGRMKTDEYVYNTVKNYRQKLEKNSYDNDQLRDISNRSYTNGFVFGQKSSYLALENENKHREIGEVYEKNGKRFFKSNSNLIKESILQVTTEKNRELPLTLTEDLKKNQELELKDFPDAKLNSNIYLLSSKILKENLDQGLNSYKNLPLDIKFEAKIGQNPKITLKYKDTKISYEGENLVEEGKNISLTKKDISENLTKLGNTIYKANEVEINIAPNIFLRKKDINLMRRRAIESLNEKRLAIYKNKPVKIEKRKLKDKKKIKREKNIDISLLKDFDNIYLRKYDKKFDGLNIFYIMDADKKYDLDFISFLKEKNFRGVVFNNYKDFVLKDELIKNGFEIRIGRYLNVFNSYTFDFYSDFSSMISSSVENSFENINKNSRIYPTEILAYGPIELMNMRHCPFSAIKKCGLVGCESCKFSDSKIKDEEGNIFDIKRRDGLSRIYSNESANIDLKKIEKSVSLLYLVRDEKDIKNIRKNKINNLGYDRGVI